MTEENTSNNNSGRTISFWDTDGTLAPLVEQAAHANRQKPSSLLYELVINHIDEYVEPDDLEPQKAEWLRLKKREIEEKYAKDLASDQKKQGTFVFFISSQIHDMLNKGADKSDVKKWLERQEKLFNHRGEMERYAHIRENIGEYYSAFDKYLTRARENGRGKFVEPELNGDENE